MALVNIRSMAQNMARFPTYKLLSRQFSAKALSSSSSSSSSSTDASHIMIFASEVPVISAMNRYRGIDEVFFAIWKRTNPEQVDKLQHEFVLPLEPEAKPMPIEPQEKLNFLLEQVGGKQCLDKVESFVQTTKSTAQTIQQIQEATSEIATRFLPSQVEPAQKAEIVNLVKSQIHQHFGSISEQVAVRQYERQHQLLVKNRNLKFYKKKLPLKFSNSTTQVFVGGRIDGQVGGKIVEVKNRMRQFLNPLPKYDVAQLQTYLFILNSKEGELVEFLNRHGQDHTTSQNQSSNHRNSGSKLTKVLWDPQMWQQEILPFLGQFSHALHEFMQETEQDTQVRFLLQDSSERKEIVRHFWHRAVPKDLWM